MEILKENIAEVITHIRETKGHSQRELAEMAGISNTMLNDIERKRVNPSLKTLQKIADALNMKVSQIFLQAEYGRSVNGKKGE